MFSMYLGRATFGVEGCFRYHTQTYNTCGRSLVHFKYWHATTALRTMAEKHIGLDPNSKLCGRAMLLWTSGIVCLVYTNFKCAWSHVKKSCFWRKRNLFMLTQYEWKFLLDAAHGLHSCYWLGGKMACAHRISLWLTPFLPSVGAWEHVLVSIFKAWGL